MPAPIMPTQPQSLRSPGQDSGYAESPPRSPDPSHLSTTDFVHTAALYPGTTTASHEQYEEANILANQQLTGEDQQRFLSPMMQVVVDGVERDLPGLRFDVDLASKEHIPAVVLHIVHEDSAGPRTSRVHAGTLRAVTRGREASCDVWDEIGPALERQWPTGMSEVRPDWTLTTTLDPTKLDDRDDDKRRDWIANVAPFRQSIYLHPGHFTGDMAYFEGTSLVLREYSWARFPSTEFEVRLGGRPWVGPRYPRLDNHLSKSAHERCRAELGVADLRGRSW
jgi:hypothetical protein